MSNALWLLIRLRQRAAWRRVIRGVKTLHGILLLVFSMAMVALVIGPNIAMAISQSTPTESSSYREFVPLFLFAYFVLTLSTSIGERAIYFSPGEVNLLFSAPFSRRQLLAYKLVNMAMSSVLISVCVAAAMAPHFHNLLYGACSTFLTVMFMNLLGMLVALLGQVMSVRLFTRTRVLLAVVAVGLFAWAAYGTLSVRSMGSITEAARAASDSVLGTMILAPFEVYASAIFAGTAAEFASWAGAGVLMNVLLVLIVYLLDANYLEGASRVSERVYNKIQRAKSGQSLATIRASNDRSARLRMFPYLGGAGPIMWRQFIIGLRTARNAMLFALMIVGIICGPLLYANFDKLSESAFVPATILGVLAYMTLMMTLQLPLGFRADADHLEVFKSLPIKPLPLAIGQLTGAVVFCTAIQLVVIAGVFVPLWAWREIFLVASILALPFNVLLFGVSAAVFLYLPTRHTPGVTSDMETTGRTILATLIQMGLFFGCLVVAALPAGIVYAVSGSPVFGLATGLLVLLGQGLLAVTLAAKAFKRFDVCAHLPG